MKAKTDNEKRVRIAEACGATWSADKFGNPMLIHGETVFCLKAGEHFIEFHLPDYLRSLDAIAEAEKAVLADGGFNADLYANYLYNLISPHCIDGQRDPEIGAPQLAWPGVYQIIRATATQRADALLAVLETTAPVGAEEVGQ